LMRQFVGRRRVLLAVFCFSVSMSVAATAERTPLDRFLDGLTTWQADFSQLLQDGKGRTQSRAEGRMLVSRPGRFRWELRPAAPGPTEFSQLVLADGRNLWFYDRDLAQATVKPASAALASAPAALLAGGANWRDGFVLRSLPKAAGLDWVEVRPRRANAEFRDARLGFIGNDLSRMVLKDNLGQVANIEFRRTQRNPVIAKAELEFVPPKDVDVIGVPQPAS
jgi:outer membrane lipoprotein carrier protein